MDQPAPSSQAHVYPKASAGRVVAIATATALFATYGVADVPPPPVDAVQHEKVLRPDEGAVGNAIARALDRLAQTQQDDGAWSPMPGPAVTALVLTAQVQAGRLQTPPAQAALRYVLERQQADGSFRDDPDAPLANYNTAIAVSALSKVLAETGDAAVRAAMEAGRDFLVGLQWQDGMTDPNGDAVTEAHPYFGGAGYGRHGRPDLSNTQLMIQALHDAGLSPDDPAYARAVTFITRLQGVPQNDYFPAGTIEQDGGVIYATAVNRERLDQPQSMANPEQIDEALAGGRVSGLRGYGSMTYAAFKSYIHADLGRDDPRVQAALAWLQRSYTVDANPGMPAAADQQGLYYYFLTQARALAAWGEPMLETPAGPVDWRAALRAKLLAEQRPDGSWANVEPRWMESDPALATAFAVLALQATG